MDGSRQENENQTEQTRGRLAAAVETARAKLTEGWAKTKAHAVEGLGKTKARAAEGLGKAKVQTAGGLSKARTRAGEGWVKVRGCAAKGWDRTRQAVGKAGSAVARHPVSPLLYVTVVAVAIGFAVFNGMYTRAYTLNIDGVEVAVVATEDDVEAIVNNVESRVASILGETYDYDADITVTPVYTAGDVVSDTAVVEDLLVESVGALVDAYALSVDGKELGYAATKEELQAVLDEIAEPYLTEDTVEYSFMEDVELFPVQLPANTEYNLSELKAILTACQTEEATYTIQKGDTFNNIAKSLGMTSAELQALNSDVNISKIYVGQELVIQQAVPFLSVKTVANETYEEVIESPIEYEESSKYYVGTTAVKQQGSDGLAEINADVTYINGVEQERTILSTTVLEEATTTTIYKGTKQKPATASKGYFTWPVRGTITSKYGYRTIFGSTSFHSGLDIAVPYGTAVKAADGGTVTFAGWKGTYGMLVIITHDSGIQTYYAHNSSLVVSVGDKVYQGQTIAKAGMTGRATGYHCHFEVRVNGKAVNPYNYLK